MKNLRKTKIAIIVVAVILIITPIVIKLTRVKADDTVRLSLVPQPYIDIVVSKEKTNVDLNTFKNDILKALDNLGVKTANVRVSEVESYQLDITENFEWQRYTHIGPDNPQYNNVQGDHITINEDNKSILFQGYGEMAYKDFLLYADTTTKTKTIEFSVNTATAYWHTLEAAGFLVNSEIRNGFLSGYAVMITQSGIGVYKFNDNVNAQSFSDTAGGSMKKFTTTVENYPFSQGSQGLGMFNFKFVVETDNITVYFDGDEIINVDVDPVAHGFGPIASYNSHACSELSEITFSNVHMEVENIKTFEQVLREPDWRKGAIKVLVDVSDFENQEINSATSLGEAIARTIKDELHYIGWGQNANRNQMQSIIDNNGKKGQFINNTNYQNCINQTAAYIQALIQGMTSTDYVILGENTILANSDETIMKNTALKKPAYI